MGGEQPFTDGDALPAEEPELRALAVELDDSDPVPEALLSMATDLYAWRTAEAELLELLVDSAAEALPVIRSAPVPRVIAFGDGARGIHLECHSSGTTIVLKGAIQPAGEQTIVAERVGGVDTTRSDTFGLFELGPMSPGRIRLIVRSAEGTDLLVTPWFVLDAA
jgi:hypothetical protein